MNQVKILVIGRNVEIVQTMLRLINKNEAWFALSAINDVEALTIFEQNEIDLIMLSSGIPASSENLLREFFVKTKPTIKIIQHFGGGSGLLFNEIIAAIEAVPLYWNVNENVLL